MTSQDPIPPAAPGSPPEEIQSTRDRWLLRLALGVIVLSLVLLVTVPLLVERRIDRIGAERVEVLSSAQREATDLAFAVAREMGLLRGFLEERDSILLHDYREMRTREEERLQRLEVLVPRLPPEIPRRLAEVRLLAANWHTAADAELDQRAIAPFRPFGADQVFARPLHEALLAGVGRLRTSLEESEVAALQDVAAAEQVGLAISIGLALFALLSTGLVVWLGRRVRSYADRARREHLEAVRASEARARLIRGVTHDLKNPLGAVTMYAELLETGIHGSLTPDQKRVVGRVHASGVQMLALVNDLVELSRAETGGLRLEPQTVDLEVLLRAVFDQHATAAAAAGISMHLDGSAPPPMVRADPQRVRQILDNLVGNAIKYTPVGGAIHLRGRSVEREPRGRGNAWGAIEVQDSGPGIPAEQQEHVFEEFVRLHETRDGFAGTGIGLAISRQLARLMEGDITLRSEPGLGCTFILWLPWVAEAVPAPPHPERNAPGETPAPDPLQHGATPEHQR